MFSNVDKFFYVTVSLIGEKNTTDLYVKSIDSHQYLHSSSCRSFHCKKKILYNQVLRLKRTCPNFFNRDVNILKGVTVIERGYSEREVWKEILRVRGFSRYSLLYRKNTREEQNKITFNLTYHPVFRNGKKIIAKLHLLLTPVVSHKIFFTNMGCCFGCISKSWGKKQIQTVWGEETFS